MKIYFNTCPELQRYYFLFVFFCIGFISIITKGCCTHPSSNEEHQITEDSNTVNVIYLDKIFYSLQLVIESELPSSMSLAPVVVAIVVTYYWICLTPTFVSCVILINLNTSTSNNLNNTILIDVIMINITLLKMIKINPGTVLQVSQ